MNHRLNTHAAKALRLMRARPPRACARGLAPPSRREDKLLRRQQAAVVEAWLLAEALRARGQAASLRDAALANKQKLMGVRRERLDRLQVGGAVTHTHARATFAGPWRARRCAGSHTPRSVCVRAASYRHPFTRARWQTFFHRRHAL